MKTCSKCLTEKTLDQFYKRSKSKDGHAAKCIDCVKAYKKQFYADNAERIKSEVRAYYVEHAEDRREYSRKYHAEHREYYRDYHAAYAEKNREAIAERSRRYRDENREKLLAREAAYRKANRQRRRDEFNAWRLRNPDKMRAAKKRWKLNNPEKVLESARICGNRRRARKAQVASVEFTAGELAQRWEYYGNKCYLCPNDATETDHVKPLAAGGAHMLCNLRPICGPCNQRKNASWPWAV